MNTRYILNLFALTGLCVSAMGQQPVPQGPSNATHTAAVLVSAPTPQPGIVIGTVTDSDGAAIPGATIVLKGPDAGETITCKSDGEGEFVLQNVRPDVDYRATVDEDGFGEYTSTVDVQPGEHFEMKNVVLKVSSVVTAVTAESPEQIATEQEHSEEQQRLLGIIPNYFVVYDPNPQPLTTGLKYRLALHAATDAVTFGSAVFVAGINQAADTPGYVEGAKGFGQRVGAAYANTAVDVMIGGAVLPSLLHQDPRYFYMGTGTKKQRMKHAFAAPFEAKGDNGKWQFNYSSIGGDVIGSALENVYYPPSDRGVGLVVSGTLIDTGARILNALAQEFVFSKFTSRGSK